MLLLTLLLFPLTVTVFSAEPPRPEKGQAYGQKAKHAASDLAFGKDVTLRTHGLDKYGRSMTNVSGCWGRFPSSA
jgi:endonuclease YncB( thermonuclease family)